ncbi:porin [Paraglaciecola aquimarina]|uniref:Porin n=1 Tax=Paraglaciecola algarum TaxID=3050085 RepID=A0ABS9D768_9ALTE|nr:porin [Paraglaciecola sp. G1-23]MCF2948755.1 porin [Paraglaciecola sp. G1-23]
MKKIITLATLCASTCFSAQAEVRINGFANFIGGMAESDESLYGYDDRISFSSESLFAIQISGDINEKMTATGQLVARGENDYDPDFEWAYLSYSATDNLSISAGRLRLPLFNYSASKDVGYSYHWISAPQSVYDVVFNNIEGVRFDYANYAGDWEYSLSASLGGFNAPTFGTDLDADNLVLLSAEATYDWLKIRAVAGVAKTSLDIANSTSSDLVAASQGLELVNAFGFGGLVDSLSWQDDKGEFYGVSVQIDKFDWFIGAEMTIIDVAETFIAQTDAYYLTAGLRLGAWTPSVTYEKSDSPFQAKFGNQVDQMLATQFAAPQIAAFAATPIGMLVDQGVQAQLGVPLTSLPEQAASPLITGAINDNIIQSLLGSQVAESSVISATLRYDYDTNIAFKFDITKRTNDLSDTDVTLIRFGANYVF